MQPIIFQKNGLIGDGEHLPGSYFWMYDVALGGASLIVTAPTGGVLTLALEVDGTPTGDVFTVGASGLPARLTLNRLDGLLALQGGIVTAGQTVRWRASETGGPSDWATAAAITMQPVPAGEGMAVRPGLCVRYFGNGSDGNNGTNAYTYDPATHAFAPTGLPAGGTVIADDGTQLIISMGGTPVLKVAADTVLVNEFYALGQTATAETPRLEFFIGPLRVATLTAGGALRVAEITEAAADTLLPANPAFYQRFEFWSGGGLTAALGKAGLTADNLTEPIQ